MRASHTFHSRLQRWFQKPSNIYRLLAGIFLFVMVLLLVPATRYKLLNLFGLRGSVLVTVLDATNDLPLKAVSVSIGGQTAKTNTQGVVEINSLRLGRQAVEIVMLAFDSQTGSVTVKAGSVQTKIFSLVAHGLQVAIKVNGSDTGKAVKGAQVSYRQNSAITDGKGIAVLTVPKTEKPSLKVTIKADGYSTKQVNISTKMGPSIQKVTILRNSR